MQRKGVLDTTHEILEAALVTTQTTGPLGGRGGLGRASEIPNTDAGSGGGHEEPPSDGADVWRGPEKTASLCTSCRFLVPQTGSAVLGFTAIMPTCIF